MIAVLCALGLAVASALLLVRFMRGPTPFDRLIAAQGLFLCGALIAATAALRDVRWIEAALALVLLGAAVTVAAVKVLRRQSFQTPLVALDDGVGG